MTGRFSTNITAGADVAFDTGAADGRGGRIAAVRYLPGGALDDTFRT